MNFLVKKAKSMMLPKYHPLWVGLTYFLILLSIALWVRDIPNQPDAFNITLQQLINTSTIGDPASFATAAIDIAKNGWVSSANEWILNLWPPGFVLLEAFIINVLGHEAPVILVLQVLAALLYSLVLALFYCFLRTSVKSKIAFILPLLIFAFPVSRVFLLEPTGVTLGETFSIGFFLISIFLTLRSVERRVLSYAAYAGLFLALSAYFRSQFEIILLAMTGWGILLLIAIRLTRLRNLIEPNLAKSVVKTIVVTLLVAHVATMPWRMYHKAHHGGLRWVQTASITFRNSVMTTEELDKIGGRFVVEGAGNLVCRIDSDACGDTENARKLFIKTFITHPVDWYALKFNVIGKYWFSSLKNWVNIVFETKNTDIATNGILLFGLIATIVLLLTNRVKAYSLWILLIWFNASLISAYTLIFTVAQFEVRYFYFPKIVGIVMFIIVTCLYCRLKKPVGTVDHNSKKPLL